MLAKKARISFAFDRSVAISTSMSMIFDGTSLCDLGCVRMGESLRAPGTTFSGSCWTHSCVSDNVKYKSLVSSLQTKSFEFLNRTPEVQSYRLRENAPEKEHIGTVVLTTVEHRLRGTIHWFQGQVLNIT